MAEVPPSEKVYVTGLPENGLDQAALKTVFGAYGTLKEVKHLPTAKACLLTFASVDEAKWVVENLDGNMPEGISECLSVKYSPAGRGGPAAQKPTGGGGWNTGGGWNAQQGPYSGGQGIAQNSWGGKGGGVGGGASISMLKQTLRSNGVLPGSKGTVPPQNQLYIRGLPSDTADGDLHELFAPFGAIPPKGVKAMLNDDGSCKGIGFVDFLNEADAQTAASAMNGTMLMDGSTLGVFIKNSNRKQGEAAKS